MSEFEPSPLTDECGPHCGVLTSGGKVKHVGHCSCEELCHGRHIPSTTVIDQTIICETNADSVDPDVKESVSE